MNRPVVTTGLEVLLTEGEPSFRGSRVGLITNPSGIDRHYRSAIDLLHESANLELIRLFGPEHGVRGETQAGDKVASTQDERTGLPVQSLYGSSREPTSEMLDGLDALVFDIHDVSVRFTTYISTLAYVQRAAATSDLTLVVLDRPNPITGLHVEGNLLDPAFTSFIGIHPIVVRHGLTIGEFARLFAEENGLPEPVVVTMRGWRRDMWFDDTGLPWVPLSPNLPTLDTVTIYPGTCFIEGTNLSEGRGTTRPFEFIGAPWVDAYRLATEMTSRELPGVAFRPVSFAPAFSKHEGDTCHGIHIYVTDREALRPVELGIHLLHACMKHDQEAFCWRSRAIGEPSSGYAIDLLAGTDSLRRSLDDGAEPADIVAAWSDDARGFQDRRRSFLLYHE